MATFDYNPITGQLDLVGSGGGTSYIDGDVEFHSDLPVTVGTPAVDSAFLVRKGSGIYFLSRKPAGIWVRELNNGNLDDWKYAGTFSDLYRDANFRIINDADTSKELAFSLSGISTGTTRTLTAPDASGRIQVEGQAIGDTTPAAGTFTTLAANNGTLTASAPALDISQTWNDSGTKFTAFKLNVTNIASNPAESTLADFQVDGVSIFSINDNGVGINGGTWATFSETFASAVLMGGVWYVNNGIAFNVAASRGPLSCVAQLGASQSIGWSSNNQPANANADLRFHREGAGILGQRNGTNAQEFRLYNTWTSASNYEALAVKWAANVVSIGPTAGGSGGTVRELHISGLPTSDVGTGILWNDGGTVKVGT